MTIESYQNLIIGSGEAGKYLAWNLAKKGQRTAVVERSMIGGSCPNIACLPSKNVIFSAKAASLVSSGFGLGVVTGTFKIDMAGVACRKRQMVDELIELHLSNYKASGAELIMGEARFTSPKTVQVKLDAGEMRILQGERVFLCVGSRASVPDIPGLVSSAPMTHVDALNLERLPEHLVILGGGYVGLEFAQAMRRFGSRVTIIQHGPRLLEREDKGISEALLELMKDEGIEVLLQTELLKVTGESGHGVELQVRTGNTTSTIQGTDILVAAGRTSNADQLDISIADVDLDTRGYIRVNERLQTSAVDVWAMGDCAGSPQFTHVGYDDFRVVLSNLEGGNRSTKDRLISYCLFTDPELAHVGMSESEAQAKEVSYRVARLPMSLVMRSYTLSQKRGFIKALIGKDDRIVGFTAFGVEASEMMAAVQTAMIGEMPYTALRDTIYTHPTAAEALVSLFSRPLSPPSTSQAG